MKDYNDLVKLIKSINATKMLDTSITAICEYQDMIGHSTDKQLTELANDPTTRSAFYWVYSVSYRAGDLLNFFMKHDSKIYEMRLERDTLQNTVDDLKESLSNERENSRKLSRDLAETKSKAEKATQDVDELKAEIIALKAKLYDYLIK